MYGEIEKKYEKESLYNKIKKWFSIIYFGLAFILYIFNCLNFFIPVVIFLLFIAFIVKEIILKKINKKNDTKLSLSQIIKIKELELFRKYSIQKNIYNEKSLICIIDHYKNLIKPKIAKVNILGILSLVVTIISLFYTDEGLNVNKMKEDLPVILFIIFSIILICIILNIFAESLKIIKGEDGMYERLEEIFSELYIECINNKDNIKKDSKESIIKKILKKLKVTK